MEKVTIIGTIRSNVGLPKGIELLSSGKRAIEAVVEAIKIVEDNEEDWTVGKGGLPNLLGQVELDASIMDGKKLKSGAVAGIKKHKNPIEIARAIMEETPHAFLIGEGGEQFADILGFTQTDLLTQNAKDLYSDFMKEKGIEEYSYDTEETMKLKKRYAKSFAKFVKEEGLMEWYARYAKENHGTVNVIARDINGDICSGVSTSGLSFKFPGRVGDSAMIGAGNYADNRYGAATCVGVGEIAINLSLARIAVYKMSKGSSAEEAAVEAIKMIQDLGENVGSLAILVMDKKGKHISAANFENYYYWKADSFNPSPEKVECIYIETEAKETGVGYHR